MKNKPHDSDLYAYYSVAYKLCLEYLQTNAHHPLTKEFREDTCRAADFFIEEIARLQKKIEKRSLKCFKD